MAGKAMPPTHAMREEWRGLSSEIRDEALDLLFAKYRTDDDAIVQKLTELGLSETLTRWIVSDALASMRQRERQSLVRSLEATPLRSRLDNFNHLLGATAFMILVLAWVSQDLRIYRNGEFPISLPIAAPVLGMSMLVFFSSLRRWIRSLRK